MVSSNFQVFQSLYQSFFGLYWPHQLRLVSPSLLCIVIIFLVLWSICSSLVYFKNGPEYLKRGTSQVFIPFMKFLQYSLVSSNFIDYHYHSLWVFHIRINWWTFTRVCETASLLISRTLLSILTDLIVAVVLIVPARPPIFSSSISSIKPMRNVMGAPVIIGITITFLFPTFFFSFLARSK